MTYPSKPDLVILAGKPCVNQTVKFCYDFEGRLFLIQTVSCLTMLGSLLPMIISSWSNLASDPSKSVNKSAPKLVTQLDMFHETKNKVTEKTLDLKVDQIQVSVKYRCMMYPIFFQKLETDRKISGNFGIIYIPYAPCMAYLSTFVLITTRFCR